MASVGPKKVMFAAAVTPPPPADNFYDGTLNFQKVKVSPKVHLSQLAPHLQSDLNGGYYPCEYYFYMVITYISKTPKENHSLSAHSVTYFETQARKDEWVDLSVTYLNSLIKEKTIGGYRTLVYKMSPQNGATTYIFQYENWYEKPVEDKVYINGPKKIEDKLNNYLHKKGKHFA